MRKAFIIGYCIVVTILAAIATGVCIIATLRGHNDGDFFVWFVTCIFGLCAIGFGILSIKVIKQGEI